MKKLKKITITRICTLQIMLLLQVTKTASSLSSLPTLHNNLSPVHYMRNAHNTQWLFHTDATFIITDLLCNKKSKIREQTLFLSIDQNNTSINGKTIPTHPLSIESSDGILSINGNSYNAFFAINGDTQQSSIAIIGTKAPPSYLSLLSSNRDKKYGNTNNTDTDCFDTQEKQLSVSQDNTSNVDSATPIENTAPHNPKTRTRKKTKKRHTKKTNTIHNNTYIPDQHTITIPSPATIPTAACKIRVLIDQLKKDQLKDDILWHLSADTGFTVWSNSSQQTVIEDTDVYIRHKNNLLFLNNQQFDAQLLSLAPLSGNTSFNGNPYHGTFLIAQQQNHVSLINSVDLEEYVFGVLRTESWPGWPLEAHKVCAIACRSYAIAMAIRAHKLNKIYHIKNTNHHQTYTGSHTNKVLRQAVDDTQGIFIAHNNQPIIAMYDICCGGVIPAHIETVNFQHIPYLARQYPCLYCKLSKPYSWETTCTLTDFEKLVNKTTPKIKNIKSITVSKKDKAGLVREVILKNNGAPLLFSGQKMYSLMKEIKSFCFQTHTKGKQVIIKGRGFGHHLGLCQWGAREMVRNGWNHKRILQFYYPGTSFMRMT